MKLKEFTQRIVAIKDKLYRFALHITGQTVEAEDVVQEVMLRIWNKREERDRLLNLEGFCMRMARNISLDKLKSKHKGHLELEQTTKISQGLNPQQILEGQDTFVAIERIVQQLPKKQQLILKLREVEELSYQEIAIQLQLSLSQVKVNLFRARNYIREQLIEIEKYGL